MKIDCLIDLGIWNGWDGFRQVDGDGLLGLHLIIRLVPGPLTQLQADQDGLDCAGIGTSWIYRLQDNQTKYSYRLTSSAKWTLGTYCIEYKRNHISRQIDERKVSMILKVLIWGQNHQLDPMKRKVVMMRLRIMFMFQNIKWRLIAW